MFGKKQTKLQNISTLIGAETAIEGNVKFTGGMRVDGQVHGNIAAEQNQPSTLVLSEQGQVYGEIKVSHLVINGSVHGSLYVSDYLELQSKAKVVGDVHYQTLEIHLGAVVEGRLVHKSAVVQDKVVAFNKLSNAE